VASVIKEPSRSGSASGESFRAETYKKTATLLAPSVDPIDQEALDYTLGNCPLKTLKENGEFFIRGVKYTLVPRTQGGYIGGGAFGKVWRAERDPHAPFHDIRTHESDVASRLLNLPECCVKVFRVESSKFPNACSAEDARRELQLHSRAGYYVQGVMTILGFTPIPSGSNEGPVRIAARWIEETETPGFIGEIPCEQTHWVVMAVEVARRGNLRKWTSPLTQHGRTLLSANEAIQKQNPELDSVALLKRLARIPAESVLGALGPGNEVLAKALMWRLLKQVERLHAHGVLHLDIKPENITMNESWEVCIIDFGHARPANDPSLATLSRFGTRGFRSIQPGACEKADVFSLGMTLYCMLVSSENVFFVEYAYEKLVAAYGNGGDNAYTHVLTLLKEIEQSLEPGHPYRPRMMPSELSAQLLARMVCSDPKSRPSVNECLEDPWFKAAGSIDFKDDGTFKNLVLECLRRTGRTVDSFGYYREETENERIQLNSLTNSNIASSIGDDEVASHHKRSRDVLKVDGLVVQEDSSNYKKIKPLLGN
jgi:serine/threonine protein kinase